MSIADELSFDIPESWEWVRLDSVIVLQSGQDLTPDKYNDAGKGVPYITGASNIEDGNVIINRWTEYGRAFANKGDLLITCKGTVGTMAVLNEERVHIARQIMAIRPFGELHIPYIQLALDTLVEGLKAAVKSMIPGISREDILSSLLPVPPANEQYRIVRKMQELQPLLSAYEKSYGTLEVLNTSFPDQLKKSILQLAVQGKLVPQDPNDEPASVLLERIQAEKERLIKEGKIKRDKNESVIFRRDNSHYEKLDKNEWCINEDLSFEIPPTWSFVRLKNVCNVVSARRVHQSDWQSSGIPFYRAREIGKLADTGSVNNELYISEELYKEFSRSGVPRPGDLMVTAVGTLGKIYIVKDNDDFVVDVLHRSDIPKNCDTILHSGAVTFENYRTNAIEYLAQRLQSKYFITLFTCTAYGICYHRAKAEYIAQNNIKHIYHPYFQIILCCR